MCQLECFKCVVFYQLWGDLWLFLVFKPFKITSNEWVMIFFWSYLSADKSSTYCLSAHSKTITTALMISKCYVFSCDIVRDRWMASPIWRLFQALHKISAVFFCFQLSYEMIVVHTNKAHSLMICLQKIIPCLKLPNLELFLFGKKKGGQRDKW